MWRFCSPSFSIEIVGRSATACCRTRRTTSSTPIAAGRTRMAVRALSRHVLAGLQSKRRTSLCPTHSRRRSPTGAALDTCSSDCSPNAALLCVPRTLVDGAPLLQLCHPHAWTHFFGRQRSSAGRASTVHPLARGYRTILLYIVYIIQWYCSITNRLASSTRATAVLPEDPHPRYESISILVNR